MAGKTAIGVALCVLAPAVVIGFEAFAESGRISENVASASGVAGVLILAAIGVFFLVNAKMQLSEYDYISDEMLSLEYGVRGIVEKRKSEFAYTRIKCISIGVSLCIIACVPLTFAGAMDMADGITMLSVSVMLIFVAAAVYLFVWESTVNNSFEKLLHEKEIENKKINKKTWGFASAYWCVCTAVYLIASSISGKWNTTWNIWPVAVVAFAGIITIMRLKKE
jgi:hypothetical protein